MPTTSAKLRTGTTAPEFQKSLNIFSKNYAKSMSSLRVKLKAIR